VRVNVPNPEGKLKPEMFVRGEVRAQVAEGGQVVAPDLAGKWISPMHPWIVKDGPGTCDVCGMKLVPAEELGYVSAETVAREAPLVIPRSAALVTGPRAVVYVEVPDQEEPTYEGREIVLGPRAGDYYLVREGLQEGELVVTNGAFKIDSEIQIQAKPSMMMPAGGAHGGASGHQH
jgi:Cu(I)/Ag(I) efflux system membrane fusion protein